jgi:RimJ/RimL family protein N-acetyltransferase
VTVSNINGKSGEISYAVFEKGEQGKGYAKEAVNALMDFCSSVYKLDNFVAEIHEDNVASEKLIFSLEFTKSKFSKYYYLK